MTTAMKLNPLTLQFPEELERIFLKEYFRKSLSQVRFALLLAGVVYASFGILDFWLFPEVKLQLWYVRYAIVLPLIIVNFILTFSANFQKLMQFSISLTLVITGVSIPLVSAIVPSMDVRDSGLIIVMLYGYTAIRLRFLYATLAGWLIIFSNNLLDIGILHTPFPNLIHHNFYIIAASLIGMFANYQVEYYLRKDFLKDRLLEAERDKAERLLLNILPQAIAQRLKDTQTTIADSFAEATILFADIVDFTKLASHISPTELVNLLSQIFSAFDRLVEKYDLEKIKTIGDAYMVVGGLPTPREDHAEAIAEMALEMQQEIARFNTETGENLNIRIGINTGPVVAGVIGIKKFIYDLWGDTVNTASRMESHGLVGHIQVTTETYERLRDKYLFQERGEIQVKGKGLMKTYFLMGRKINAQAV